MKIVHDDRPMTTERWRRANTLFEALLELPRSDRHKRLAAWCEDDPDLRTEVEKRLRIDAEAGAESFLSEPLVAGSLKKAPAAGEDRIDDPRNDGDESAENSPHPASPTMRLGPYRVLEEIGRGGMGTVYAAERDDDAFDRRVAIKVISAGTENEEIIERLEDERRILALLEHPNIARIYDGGATDDGLPWIVMEHVSGEPIDRFCEGRDLSIRQRITLFMKVVAAVDYAHRNLVVHRDLKPSNILVTPEAEPKLLDFGVAKLLDPEPQTASSADVTVPWRRRLTLNYASPEQLHGQRASTTNDVYSLGVLLFRILTGNLPHRLDGLSPWQAEKALASTDPPRPSAAVRSESDARAQPSRDGIQRSRRLRGDLDAIVLKALRREPETRYRSAGHLAEDLDRFLNGFPVAARRGNWRYRAGKLLRRHRLTAALTASLLTLGILFTVTTWNSVQRLSAREAQLQDEKAKLGETNRFLSGIFESAGPFIDEGVPLTIRQAVDRHTELLGRNGPGLQQPVVRASILSMLGWLYLDLRDQDQALTFHQQALEIRRASRTSNADIAESLNGIAAAQSLALRLDEALAYSDQAMAAVDRIPGGPTALSVSLLNVRVEILCKQEAWATADPVAAEALTLAQEHTADDLRQLTTAIAQHALILNRLGQPDHAVRLYRQLESLQEQRFGPNHPNLGLLYNNIAVIEANARRFDHAVDFYQRADTIYKTAFDETHWERIPPLTSLGKVLAQQGDIERAESTLRIAVDVATRSPALGPQHEIYYFGRAALALGTLLEENGRCAEVLEMLGPKVRSWSHQADRPVVRKARALIDRCAIDGQ